MNQLSLKQLNDWRNNKQKTEQERLDAQLEWEQRHIELELLKAEDERNYLGFESCK